MSSTISTESLEKTFKLIDAKDRAQVAATTAMSVVHVALLRTLINGGPSANKYYYVVLVLIILSLVLQVCAGLLALALSHMKSYFQKHKEDACSALFNSLCCCCCSLSTPKSAKAKARDKVTHETRHGKMSGSKTQSAESTSATGRQEAWQCPMQITDNIESLETACDEFLSAELKSDLLVAEVDVEMEYLNSLRENTTHGDADARHDKESPVYQEALQNYQSNISRNNHVKRHNAIIHKQRNILVSQYDDSKKKDVLKRLSFWQHVLNYILYFVFIFNIFITGFGVSPWLRNEIRNATRPVTP